MSLGGHLPGPPCPFKPSPAIAWWQGETPANPFSSLSLPPPPPSAASFPFSPSREPPGGIRDTKFPFGAGKFLVCRFLGNVAGDGARGETLACAIPVCPQPRGRTSASHILRSGFSPGWKITTSVRRGDWRRGGGGGRTQQNKSKNTHKKKRK